MGKQTSAVSKEAIWRNHLARYATSGKSIVAFCRDEAISEGNFYAWRARLRQDKATSAVEQASAPASTRSFIDLGPVKTKTLNDKAQRAAALSATPEIDVRIDLGHGIILTITRR